MIFKILHKPTFTVFVCLITYCSSYTASASVSNKETDRYTAASTTVDSNSINDINKPQSNQEQASKNINILPYTAIYTANIKGLNAKLTRTLKSKGDGLWEIQNIASVFLAKIEESSLMQIKQQQVIPLSYNYKNPLSSKRNSSLQFDWSNNHARDIAHEGKSIALKSGSYDSLSLQMQLSIDLIQQGQQFKDKQYYLIDKDRIKTYQIEVIEEEILETPAGKFKAIKLKQYRPGKNKHTLIWMAKDWQYMILRLEIFKDDESENNLQLLKADVNGKPIIKLTSH